MVVTMSQKYEKLKTLLKELFQLDQPDLDFGLYRVMHAKSAEVSQFLDKDLLPQVKEAFGQYKMADKAEIEKELANAQVTIDLIVMLRDKTKGNLSAEEEKLINNSISDLQLNYADEVNKPDTKTEEKKN